MFLTTDNNLWHEISEYTQNYLFGEINANHSSVIFFSVVIAITLQKYHQYRDSRALPLTTHVLNE